MEQDWEQRKLKDILIVNSGRDYKHLSLGTIPVFGTGGYMLSVDDKLSNRDGIGLGRKGTINKPQYLNAPFWTVDTLFYLTSRDNNSLLFQYYVTQSINWLKFDESTGVPSLSKNTIENINKYIPSYGEQLKNGEFFKRLDSAIELHQRKINILEALKKAYLNRMFPIISENVPRIRFNGINEEWERYKLGDLGSVAMNRRIFKDETSSNGEIPFYKIGTFGKKANAFITREKFEEYKHKYPYPQVGDTLISASGSIGRTVVYKGEEAYYQDSNIVWLKHDGNIDNTFLNQFYNIIKWSGVEGTTIKRLYNKNILNTEITLPSLIEQKEIGRFLNILDSITEFHQSKLNALKKLKQVYLNKIFI